MNGYHVKNPDDATEMVLDWAARYLEPGETITADLGWQVAPVVTGGLTAVSASNTATTTTATLNGGRAGDAYLVAGTVQTDRGRELSRSITVRIANL